MTTRRRFLAIAAAALASRPAAAAETARWQGVALGAEADVTLHGPAEQTGPALVEVQAILRQVEALFSLHDPGSALAALNRDGRLAPAPVEFLGLLRIADRAHRATGGRFDPSVQPLWHALAAGGDATAARRLLGWKRVRVSQGAVTLAPGQALTLNGIAQGFATDMVADRLAARGFGRALIHIGEHRALGGPWRLGLEDPAAGFLGTRTLNGGALATSSPRAMLLTPGEGHILDPLGGRPRWSTVSVEADRAALADALSTAFCLMDRAGIARARAALPGVGRVTLVDDDGNLSTLG